MKNFWKRLLSTLAIFFVQEIRQVILDESDREAIAKIRLIRDNASRIARMQKYIKERHAVWVSVENADQFLNEDNEQAGKMCAVITDGKIYWVPCDKVKQGDL